MSAVETRIKNRKMAELKCSTMSIKGRKVKVSDTGVRMKEVWDLDENNKVVRRYVPLSNIRVRQNRQDIPPEKLKLSDFRDHSIPLWDQMQANYKKGLGWKSDEALSTPGATLESFLGDFEED